MKAKASVAPLASETSPGQGRHGAEVAGLGPHRSEGRSADPAEHALSGGQRAGKARHGQAGQQRPQPGSGHGELDHLDQRGRRDRVLRGQAAAVHQVDAGGDAEPPHFADHRRGRPAERGRFARRQGDLAGDVLRDQVVALLQHLLHDGRQRRRGHARDGGGAPWRLLHRRRSGDADTVRGEQGRERSGRHARGVGRPRAEVAGVVGVFRRARRGQPPLIHLKRHDLGDVSGADVARRPAGRETGAGVQRRVVADADGPAALRLQRPRRRRGQFSQRGRVGIVLGRERVHRERRIAAADQDDAVRGGAVHHPGGEPVISAEHRQGRAGGDDLRGGGRRRAGGRPARRAGPARCPGRRPWPTRWGQARPRKAARSGPSAGRRGRQRAALGPGGQYLPRPAELSRGDHGDAERREPRRKHRGQPRCPPRA